MTSNSIWEYLNTGFYYSLIHPFSPKSLDLTLFAIQTDALLSENRWSFVCEAENHCFGEQSKATCTLPSSGRYSAFRIGFFCCWNNELVPHLNVHESKMSTGGSCNIRCSLSNRTGQRTSQPKNQAEATCISDLFFFYFLRKV